MSFNKLSQNSALSSGSEAWVLPDIDSCLWTRKIDWHVNFQISKARQHSCAQFAPELIETLTHLSREYYRFRVDSKAPLMISTSKLLPNRMSIVIPFQNEISIWLKKVCQVWEKSKKPSMRIFLPDSINEKEAAKSISTGPLANDSISIVPHY